MTETQGAGWASRGRSPAAGPCVRCASLQRAHRRHHPTSLPLLQQLQGGRPAPGGAGPGGLRARARAVPDGARGGVRPGQRERPAAARGQRLSHRGRQRGGAAAGQAQAARGGRAQRLGQRGGAGGRRGRQAGQRLALEVCQAGHLARQGRTAILGSHQQSTCEPFLV